MEATIQALAPNGNGHDVQPLFSKANVTDTRRAKAWLEDRIKRGRSEIFSEVVELTPELAELLLQINDGNRPVREAKVVAFTTDIANGDWELNGEPIIVSATGEMNDGQHRSLGVIRAGRSIRTIITFGVTRESRMTVDQGGVRTAGNYLAMDGVPYSNDAAAIASFIWQYENFGALAQGSNQRATKAQVRQTYAAHPRIHDSIKAVPSGARIVASKSLLAFCHFVLARRNRTEADFFILKLGIGDMLRANDPIKQCRDKLTDKKEKFRAPEKVELIFLAWNASRRGAKWRGCPAVDGTTLPKLER